MRNEKLEGRKENFFEKKKGLWKREKRNERKKIIKIGLYERKRNR